MINFTFVLRVLPVKIGVDSTPQAHRILLRPKLCGGGKPDWNIGMLVRNILREISNMYKTIVEF